MSRDRVIRPKPEPTFFVGWDPKVPEIDRRMAASIGIAAGLAGLLAALGLGAAQRGPGSGTWDQGAILDIDGVVRTTPYPLIRTTAFDGAPRTALLGCMTKCGVQERLADMHDAPAAVTGSLIARGRNRMVAVADGPDWIRRLDAVPSPELAAAPVEVDLGPAVLTGEILDSKCWFGAMRPGSGKPHKACAALCLRYGIPPSFYARDRDGREHAFLMTDPDGGPIAPTERFLALVADPARATGRFIAVDDMVTFRVDPEAGIARI